MSSAVNKFLLLFLGDEVLTVKTPAFAESVTEGDVRWEKGKYIYIFFFNQG